MEGKMLIENIATNTSKEIIRGWRNPIAKMEDIIEYKHDCATHNSVYHSYQDKLHESFVSEQTYLIF